MRRKWIVMGGLALVLVAGIVGLGKAVEFSILSLLGTGSTAASEDEYPTAVAPATRIAPAFAADLPHSAHVVPDNAPSSGPGFVRGSPEAHRGRRGAMASRIMGAQISAALVSLNPRLASCPDSTTQGGFAGGAALGEGASQQRVLLLEVAPFDGRVRILDASLAMPRSASQAFVDCARGVLRGQLLEVPAAKAGDRAHIAVEILPMQSQRPEDLLEQVRQAIEAETPARQ